MRTGEMVESLKHELFLKHRHFLSIPSRAVFKSLKACPFVVTSHSRQVCNLKLQVFISMLQVKTKVLLTVEMTKQNFLFKSCVNSVLHS